MAAMPEIDFAFLADAAETQPGQKFHVLGGGITRIGGRTFPLRHPHLALVVGLLVTAPETEREHELRIVLLDPDGARSPARPAASSARGHPDGRDAILTFSIDLWNLTFPSPGDYSFRILVNGSERKRLALVLVRPGGRRRADRRRRPTCDVGRSAGSDQRPAAARRATSSRRSTRPALVAARAADRLVRRGARRGRRRAGSPTSSRCPTASATTTSPTCAGRRCARGRRTGRRTPSGTRCPRTVTEPFLDAIDRLLKELAQRETSAASPGAVRAAATRRAASTS